MVGTLAVEDFLRFDAAPEKIFCPLQVEARMVEVHFRFMDDGTRFAYRGFEGLAVDLRDDLPNSDAIAGIDVEPLDYTADLRSHLDEVLWFNGP
jgi:hypothetical protein